jgi:hypothetical protein
MPQNQQQHLNNNQEQKEKEMMQNNLGQMAVPNYTARLEPTATE